MDNKLTSLLNIGPAVAGYLNLIGIVRKDDFLDRDPYEIFEQLLKINPSFPKPLLASLVGAQLNIPWYEIYEQAASEFEKSHPNHSWKKYHK